MREKEIEQKLVQTIESKGGMCLKWVCPGWAGVPDRICLLPGGRIFFVELKAPGGVVSPRQKWWAAKLRTLGFDHIFVFNEDDLNALLLS